MMKSPSMKLPPVPSKRTTAAATANTATAVLNSKEKSSSGQRALCNKGVACKKQTQAAIVLQAAKDLLQQRAEAGTGGNATYGDVKHILQTYHDQGHDFVTRARLSYQVEKLARKNVSSAFPSFINVSPNEESSVQSELTDSFGPAFKFNESLSFAAGAERSNQPTPTAVVVTHQQNKTGHPIATISTEQSNSNQQTVTRCSTELRSDA
jgi:hypothetical protein